MSPPDAAGAGSEAGPDQSALDKRLSHEGTSEVDPNQHNRWLCCATDRIPMPCPRCCRCWNRELCEHRRPGADFVAEVA